MTAKPDKRTRKETVRQYRMRFRSWAMWALPSMPEDEWDQLLNWVYAFGADHGNRKARRTAFKRLWAFKDQMSFSGCNVTLKQGYDNATKF